MDSSVSLEDRICFLRVCHHVPFSLYLPLEFCWCFPRQTRTRTFVSLQVELKGLSGPIEFKEGRRIQFKLDLLKLKQHALVKVGEWSPSSGVNITDRSAFFDPGTMNVTLVVVTIPVSKLRKYMWFLF